MKIIISTALSTLTGLVIGYLVSKVKEYSSKAKDIKTNNGIQNEALKLLLQSNLTNAFFVYEETRKIKDYQYKNWLNMFKIYKKLNGNDFVDELEERLKELKIEKTDILK